MGSERDAAQHVDVAARFASQLLSGPRAGDVPTVVERILAVQAQDLPAARLAVRSRTSGLTAGDVDAVLTRERTHGVSWLNRGTLHLVHRDDYWGLQRLTAPTSVTGNLRRLAQEGVSPAEADRAVGLVEGWLASDGPLTRRELGRRLAAQGVPTAGQALVHILMRASLLGLIVRGPVVGSEQAFVLVRDWWGTGPQLDRDETLARLARRFLAGHAPANDRDLARWAGLPLRDVRRGLAAIEGETVTDDRGLVRLASQRPSAELPAPRLLGGFDPVLMGWTDRAWVLDGAQRIVTVNGLFRPFALVEGRAVATWRRPGGTVLLEPFEDVDPSVERVLADEAADVERFLAPRD